MCIGVLCCSSVCKIFSFRLISNVVDESDVLIVHELVCMPLEVLYDAFGSVCVEVVLL